MNRKDVKTNLIFVYLLCNLIFITYNFVSNFSYYSSRPVALVFKFISLVTVVTALVCFYKKESYSWYLTFYSIVWWPLSYSVFFYNVLMRTVISESSAGEVFKANLFIGGYTVVGFLFALLLFDKEVCSNFNMKRVNYLPIMAFVVSIFLFNIAFG